MLTPLTSLQGLYITKGIVQQHGGTVVAESEGLGKGTTFSLTLPAHVILNPTGDEEAGMMESAVPSTSMSVEEDIVTARRVLVVDDVLANRRLLARLLEKNGDVCEQAEDGMDCLAKVTAAGKEGLGFDIILLDYEMPKMNGPTCARKLRAAGCSSFIVGITGNCLAEDVDLFKSNGADDVLAKPFKLYRLQAVWARHGILRSGLEE